MKQLKHRTASIIEIVTNALTARGFSQSEADQMIRHIKHADGIEEPTNEQITKAYNKGYYDCLDQFRISHQQKCQQAMAQAQAQYAAAVSSNPWGFSGYYNPLGGHYSSSPFGSYGSY